MRRMSLSLPWERAPRSIRNVALYAGIAVAGTAFLFFLHFLGNQTPHDLIQERIAAEAETDQTTTILQSPVSPKHEYCYISSMALAGSKHDGNYRALRDAILLPRLHTSWFEWCIDVAIGADRDAPEPEMADIGGNTRYWYGAKAIYSISLRWMSVINYYRFTGFLIQAAYVLLGISLLLLGMRAFFIGLPVVVAGLFFAANQYFSDLVFGPPHFWTVFSVAVLVLLFRWKRQGGWVISIFCFIMGMVSSYFWIFDGHTILAVPAIGLAGWLGYHHIQARERVRKSLAMIGLYIAGFILCFTLSQTAKQLAWPESPFSDRIFVSAIDNTLDHLGRTASESSAGFTEGNLATVRSCFGCGQGWQTLPIIREFRSFRAFVPGPIAVGQLLGIFSGLALVVAVSSAIFLAYRGNTRALWNATWMLVLLLLLCVQFILPDDRPIRSFRMVSFAIALCWSAFVIVTFTLPPKIKVISGGCFIAGCFIVTLYLLISWDHERSDLRAVIENNDPDIAEEFDVYYHENHLVFTMENCDSSLSMPLFHLHIYPEHAMYLDHEEHPFNNKDFSFRSYQSPAMHCTAVVALPEYEIARIRAGQHTEGGAIWSGEILATWGDPDQKSLQYFENSELGSPVSHSGWDIFVNNDAVVYYKEHCSLRDVVHPFFLHIFPTKMTDLPMQSREHGFENRDFWFTGFDQDNRRVGLGARVGEDCVAVRDLPSYDIASIETGQYSYGISQGTSVGQLWKAVIDPARE